VSDHPQHFAILEKLQELLFIENIHASIEPGDPDKNGVFDTVPTLHSPERFSVQAYLVESDDWAPGGSYPCFYVTAFGTWGSTAVADAHECDFYIGDPDCFSRVVSYLKEHVGAPISTLLRKPI
jgi:hypothetical protein